METIGLFVLFLDLAVSNMLTFRLVEKHRLFSKSHHLSFRQFASNHRKVIRSLLSTPLLARVLNPRISKATPDALNTRPSSRSLSCDLGVFVAITKIKNILFHTGGKFRFKAPPSRHAYVNLFH